jgi:mono/diheme cytochrome c family protein
LSDCAKRSGAIVFLSATLAVATVLFSTHGLADASHAASGGAPVERWYTLEQVQRGGLVYTEHCAVCHGANAEGTESWRQRGADGKFPPPPINGTAHAWHHPMKMLGAQIKFGAPGGRGSMPGFADKLSDEQIIDVIAWFQDRWPDAIYASWAEIQLRSR